MEDKVLERNQPKEEEQIKSRGERRKQKTEEAPKGRKKRIRIRLIPIWLRIIIVLVLMIVFFFIGTMIGYGIIGDGNPFDVFKKSTWTHIFDIVNKETPE